MNLIPLLSKDNPVCSSVDFKYVLYFYLLSAASSREGELVSHFTVEEVYDRFKGYEPAEIAEAIADLLEDDLILVERGEVRVGTDSGVKKLFQPADASLEEYLATIEGHVDSFLEEARGGQSAALARRLRNHMDSLRARPVPEWRLTEFINLFKTAYAAIFQEDCRDFNQKEAGQMKNILRHYDNSTFLKMIVYFIANSTEFTKSAPNVGLMSYHKDNLFLRVKNKTTRYRDTSRKRTERDESGF